MSAVPAEEPAAHYVILAELRARPGCGRELAALLARHSLASRQEPGCFAFDVCQDPDDPFTFVLYEVYRDEPAYRHHRATPHYRQFRDTAPPLVDGSGDSLLRSRRVLSRRPQESSP